MAADPPSPEPDSLTASASDSLVEAKRLVLMGQIGADVGHELNNLFGKIIGLAEMTLDQVADRPDACAELETLIGVTEQGARIVERLEACCGWTVAEPRRFDLAAVAEAARAAAEARRPDLSYPADRPAPPCKVVADEALVRVALDAVLENAPRWGARRIEVSCRSIPPGEDGPGAEVIVRDDGAGMTPEVLARAFEPFFTTRPPGEGMGVGLTLAKYAVAACRGRIEAESPAGGGTAVRLFLPAAEGRPSEVKR